MPNPKSRMRNKMAEMAQSKTPPTPTVVDARGAVAGRLASVLAKRLMRGEHIVVLHSEKVIVSGSAESVKARYLFKTTVGTRRKGPFPSRMPHLLFKRTVRGMLPYQRPNGRAAFKRLQCHIGVPAEYKSAKPEVIADAVRPVPSGLTFQEISQYLGKRVEVNAAG